MTETPTKEQILAALVRVLDGQLFPTWMQMLEALFYWCEKAQVSVEFRYHNGLFQEPVPGAESPHDFGEPYLDETHKGYTIMVGGYSFSNQGNEVFYDAPAKAVFDGLRLLKDVLEEREDDGDNATD